MASLERAWPTRGRPNNVLLLRLVLALSVLVAHSVDLLMGDPGEPVYWLTRQRASLGDFAVEGFMVLSGYLVAESLACSAGTFDFLWKRVLRIYPAFALCVLVTVLVVAPLAGGRLASASPGGLALSTLLLQEPRVPGAMLALPFRGSLNGSLWTIAIEFQCYLVLAGLGVIGVLRRPPLVHIAAWTAVLFYGGTVVLALWTPFARLSVFFAIGAWLYFNAGRVPRRGRWALLALAALVVADALPGPGFFLVLPFAWSYLVLWLASAAVVRLPGWLARSDFSYGAYLYGWPVQQLVIGAGVVVPPLVFVISLPITLGLAAISWYGVERQALALKRRRRGRVSADSLANRGNLGLGGADLVANPAGAEAGTGP